MHLSVGLLYHERRAHRHSFLLQEAVVMQKQDVARVLSDPLAQELMQSSTPARLAYVGPDGFPRAIPIGFHWNGAEFVLCTVPDAPKVPALKANPKVALTVDTNTFPPHVLLVRGTAAIDIVDGVPPEYLAALERVSDPTSGMLLRRRCARCTSRWLVLRSR